MTPLFLLDSMKGAVFSACRRYRYTLWRDWHDPCEPTSRCVFIGLNPSTADEQEDDPTIRRCIGFAKSWGFPGMTMLNAYAWRSTDPTGLLIPDDPIGPGNDAAISEVASTAPLIVCCWGTNCLRERHEQLVGLLRRVSRQSAVPVRCFGVNADGTPKHPLYLSKSTPLVSLQ